MTFVRFGFQRIISFTAWYHLSCGPQVGSLQLSGEKKSFCFFHLSSRLSPRKYDEQPRLKRTVTFDAPNPKRKKSDDHQRGVSSASLSQEISLYQKLAPNYEAQVWSDRPQETGTVGIQQSTVHELEVFIPDLVAIRATDLEDVMNELEKADKVLQESEKSPGQMFQPSDNPISQEAKTFSSPDGSRHEQSPSEGKNPDDLTC